MSAELDCLAAMLADLDGYIDRKAAEKAAPAIAEAERAANEAIQEAQSHVQRQQDLVAELRRRLAGRDGQLAEALDAKVRIANALGVLPYQQWPLLAAAVECRLAERESAHD